MTKRKNTFDLKENFISSTIGKYENTVFYRETVANVFLGVILALNPWLKAQLEKYDNWYDRDTSPQRISMCLNGKKLDDLKLIKGMAIEDSTEEEYSGYKALAFYENGRKYEEIILFIED